MIVHVNTQGARILREGRHLLVKKEADIYHTLFPHRLEQLLIYGNVSLTPSALKLLFRENIDTVFLRQDGRFVGRLAVDEGKNVLLRKAQFRLSDDDPFCLRASRAMVSGKLANMVVLLQRIKRSRDSREAGKAAVQVKEILDQLPKADNLESLRGLEGRAAVCYFAGFRAGLDRDFGFRKRVRRPPTDPVNSVLSLLYTLLLNRIIAAVRVAGLDPYPGVFHALDYGRFSLPLDLIEEFRTPVADTLTLSLFNLGVLKEKDFFTLQVEETLDLPQEEEDAIDRACADPLGRMGMPEESEDVSDLEGDQFVEREEEPQTPTGKPPVRLYPEAFRRLLTAFEKKLQTEFYHPVACRRMTYAETTIFQARQYRRLVEGEIAEYTPFLLR